MTTTDPQPVGSVLTTHAERVVARALSRIEDDPALAIPDLDDEVVAFHREMRVKNWLSLVPPRYDDPTLDKLRASGVPVDVVGDLTAWAAEPTRNLVILGPVGTGKTYAAWAALRQPYLDGRAVKGIGVVDLLDGLRPSTEDDSTTTRLRGIDLLFLDDFGAERPSEWTAERIYALINHRWEHNRPVVVTSNLDPAGLREALGPRSYSRLVDGAVVIRLAGVDRRRPRAKD